MPTPLEKLTNTINALTTISDEEKAVLLADLAGIKKEFGISEFVLKRLQKDKSIVVNLLENTIKDLEKSKQQVVEKNQQLVIQQEELKEQKRIIEEKSAILNENLRKLQLSYKELEQFSYIASHDLKSPLRNIASFAQLLKNRYHDQIDQDANEFIDFIVAGVFQMSEVINALLEYSRVGHSNNAITPVDLNNIIKIVQFNLTSEIEEGQATIHYDRLPIIYANKTGIIQLFQNLIGNAVKFRSNTPPVINILCESSAEEWLFKVSDNGVGMDEAFQGKAFFPFQRLTNREMPGMGIGLAICKKIVKMHNGDIYYKKNPTGGTTFVFTISANMVKEDAENNPTPNIPVFTSLPPEQTS